jgi:hypothetical protein
LIEPALEGAVKELADVSVEPVIDRDTLDVPGCPDIGETIFRRSMRLARSWPT